MSEHDEGKERRRAAPGKIMPVRKEQPQDQLSHMAAYFGVDLPPSIPSLKQHLVKSASSSKSASKAGPKETPDAFKLPIAELEDSADLQVGISTNGEGSWSTTPNPKLRSSSRLAHVEAPLQSIGPVVARTGKDEPEASVQVTKQHVFSPPAFRAHRNPADKENHNPPLRTPIKGRQQELWRTSTIVQTRRRSTKWGAPLRPDQENEDLEETSFSSLTKDENILMEGELLTNDTAGDPIQPPAKTEAPELSVEDLHVRDSPVLTRQRQGHLRDYEDPTPAVKKTAAPKMESDIPTIPETSTFSTSPVINKAGRPTARHQEKEPQLRAGSPTRDQIRGEKELPGRSTPAPQTKPTTQPANSQFSTPQAPASKHPSSEGIASIAQSLAVGSAKAPGAHHKSLSTTPWESPRPAGGGGIGISSIVAQKLVTTPGPSTMTAKTMMAPAAPSSAAAGAIESSTAPSKAELGARAVLMVNDRPYTRLSQIGKGGSSRVYKVLASNSRVFALKKVSFERADQGMISGYINEINLLTKLANNNRIIRLWDAEINTGKGTLSLLMECGEIDLAHMLLSQREQPFDLHFIGLYWRQMLEAVQVIHDLKIVHSDLKPANFLLVEGSLKLIDFGIANAIANDTTNVHREGQLGTANYMSPEAVGSNPGGGCRKLGRASDVWSLGCILYQMVYGMTPFQEFTNVFVKMNRIGDPEHPIAFPERTLSPLQVKKQQATGLGGAVVATTTTATTVPAGTDLAAASTVVVKSEPVATTVKAAPSLTLQPLATEGGGGLQQEIEIDARLRRIMKGCLTRDPKYRLLIPDMLKDDFLQPPIVANSCSGGITGVNGTAAPSSSSSSSFSGSTITLDVDLLQEVMRASMVFEAGQNATTTISSTLSSSSSSSSSSWPSNSSTISPSLSPEKLQQAAKNMMAQLQQQQRQKQRKRTLHVVV